MNSAPSPRILVTPTTVEGAVVAPPSKSSTVRAIAGATLTPGTTTIVRASRCDDAGAALRVAERLGARCDAPEPDPVDPSSAERLTLAGPLRPSPEAPHPVGPRSVDCGESALTLRLFAPIAAALAAFVRLEGRDSLLRRPVHMLEAPLRSLGVACRSRNGLAPLELRGRLCSGSVEVDGSVTSQGLSGLLMALPICAGDSSITVHDLASEGYVALTRSMMRAFGVETTTHETTDQPRDIRTYGVPGDQRYRGTTITVEGDWSGAAYLLVAGATGGRVRVTGLAPDSDQPDRAIVDALRRARATVRLEGDAVEVEQASLRAFDFDATGCPDLFPPLAALACRAAGTSVIRGASRLAHKESHRAKALAAELTKLGAKVEVTADALRVTGARLTAASTDAHGDHRIAMACAVAALGADGPVSISDGRCVTKSYPAFFEHLATLGVSIT